MTDCWTTAAASAPVHVYVGVFHIHAAYTQHLMLLHSLPLAAAPAPVDPPAVPAALAASVYPYPRDRAHAYVRVHACVYFHAGAQGAWPTCWSPAWGWTDGKPAGVHHWRPVQAAA